MKKITLVTILLMTLVTANGQEHKFSPEKFQADLEAYIIRETKLTPQESARLLPLLRELNDKKRALRDKMRDLSKHKPSDESGCLRAIKELDKLNIDMRHLEHGYHKRMIEAVSASKVYDVIKAENRFHRHMMKGWQKGRHR